jgi:uncharacterized protein YcgI (DUF1989 family)
MAGPAVARLVIPPQTGTACRVDAGSIVRVIDIDGTQVADLWAFVADDLSEWLSPGHTRSSTGRLFPAVGQNFFTNRRRPILRFTEDTSPGAHDMLYPPCDLALHEELGVHGPHPSCRDNLERALASLGVSVAQIPDSVNLFQNSPPDATGAIPVADALSRPGDSVSLEALHDVILVVTACSVDVPPGNGDRCTAIGLEVSPSADQARA